jgi:cell division protein FtsB
MFIRRLNWFLLFMLLVMGLFGKRGWLDLKRMESENKKLERLISETQTEMTRLEAQVIGLRQNRQIQEHTIRQVLGYIKPDEIVIEF